MTTIDPNPAPSDPNPIPVNDRLTIELDSISETCRDGLMAVAVQAGMATVAAIMAEEAASLCGDWNQRDPDRTHVRGGTTPTSVVMGGQRLPTRRPRVRTIDASGNDCGETQLQSYTQFASDDLLGQVVAERMLAGVATRQYSRVGEPIGNKAKTSARSISKSAVSRRFVSGTAQKLDELMGRDLSGLDVVAVMIDGVIFAGQATVAALLVTVEGIKVPAGIVHGDTENTTVVAALLQGMLDRGLNIGGGVLAVIDGGKALRAGIERVFGDRAVFQRCTVHKRRNAASYLPRKAQGDVDRRLRGGFGNEDPVAGRRQIDRLIGELDKSYPDAAASLREGLDDMFTVRGLGIDGALARTLVTTNMIESMFSTVTRVSANVKRWRDGEMRKRWIAAGLLEAEKNFNRVKGHRQLPDLQAAIGRRVEGVTPPGYGMDSRKAA